MKENFKVLQSMVGNDPSFFIVELWPCKIFLPFYMVKELQLLKRCLLIITIIIDFWILLICCAHLLIIERYTVVHRLEVSYLQC